MGKINYCPNCGSDIIDDEKTCSQCGEKLEVYKKNPTIAALLTFFIISGLGQLYNGQKIKALAYILIELFIFIIIPGILLESAYFDTIAGLWILSWIVWRILAIIDAYSTAEKINRGEKHSSFFNTWR